MLVTLAFPPARGGMQRLMGERVSLSRGRVVVVAPHRAGQAWERYAGSSVWRWPGHAGGWPGVRRLWQLAWMMRGIQEVRKRFEVQDLELGQSLPFGLGVWGSSYAYTVWAFGDEILKPLMHPLARPLLRNVLRRARCVYAISSYTAQLVRQATPAARVSVVHPWPAAVFSSGSREASRRVLGVPQDVLLLLTVARLEPRKGVDRVLNVLPSLARRFPKVRYAVVGTGSARQRWEKQAERLGVADRVWWVGDVEDPALVLWYRAADIFVLVPTPGRGEVEGFGLVYVEAAACGVPVVAGSNGGTSEAVVHERTGLVVPPREAHLESALVSLLTDADKRFSLGQQGILHAQTLRLRARDFFSGDSIACSPQ